MDPITDKYAVFERYLNNMAETEKELRDNIQEAGDLIRNRTSSINSDKETLAYAKSKLEDITDSKELTKIKGHIADLSLRIEASNDVLSNTVNNLAQYEQDLSGSQLVIMACDAVDEQYQEIIKYQKLFHEVLQKLQEAKNTYLKSIIRLGEIRNTGNWSIERLKKALLHAKIVSPSYAEFNTNFSSLIVDLPEIKTAFHRGR